MKIEFSDKKPLYKPTHLEELSNEIKQKIVEKNLNIFQKMSNEVLNWAVKF